MKHYRTVFLSDLHLGTAGCKATNLLAFLKSFESEYLYLIGDIVDIWSMRRYVYWPTEQNQIVSLILKKAKHGTKVIYIPGNHDEVLREFVGSSFGNIELTMEAIHTTMTGLNLLVIHGDQFDGVIQKQKWLAEIGSVLYDYLLAINGGLNKVRKFLGRPYWSLSAYLKNTVKNVVKYVYTYETVVSESMIKHQTDGVICGHIHKPELKYINNILYGNCGDFVENCSAIVESKTGELQLIHYADLSKVKTT